MGILQREVYPCCHWCLAVSVMLKQEELAFLKVLLQELRKKALVAARPTSPQSPSGSSAPPSLQTSQRPAGKRKPTI
jgi:hypothetical protein